jgi:hypothetical protein
MASRTPVRLTDRRVCQILGITQQRRQALVKRGLIGRTPKGGASLGNALELAGLLAVVDALGATEGAVAWGQLSPTLRSVVPGPRLDVVYQQRLGVVALARTDADVRRLTADHGPAVVIDLGLRLAAVADAFRRFAAVSPTRRKGSAEGAPAITGE